MAERPAAPADGRGGGRRKRRRPVLELLYELRTEGESPARQAAAVAAGVFIGCSPFYGLHLALCILVARLFRLNQIRTYVAAHVSLPFLWPLLLIAELDAGRLVRGAPPLALSLAEVRHLRPWQFGVDLLVGSALVGALLAAVLATLTYRRACSRRRHPDVEALIDETSRRYIPAGVFAWEFVRGKLRHDPLYFALLARGGLPEEGLLLDLGCGRGILMALLATARAQAERGIFPAGWTAPGPGLRFQGVDFRDKAARAARQALGGEATISTADLRALRPGELPQAAAIFLLDVLHYLAPEEQEELLDHAAAALAPGGLLVVREADAAAGGAFARTRAAERLAALLRGDLRQRLAFRSAAEWTARLAERGLAVRAIPMSRGTPFANVLLEARAAEAPGSRG
jgi:uncharacterized protein (DUF2062 family)/trans-aconitate methyltransferase